MGGRVFAREAMLADAAYPPHPHCAGTEREWMLMARMTVTRRLGRPGGAPLTSSRARACAAGVGR